MPWQEQTEMSLKREFVRLASEPDANISALCRRFGIGRPTAYLLLERYRTEGDAGLAPRPRRPHTSPRRTDPDLEAADLAIIVVIAVAIATGLLIILGRRRGGGEKGGSGNGRGNNKPTHLALSCEEAT